MFLCDECHGNCPCKSWKFMTSRGKCESCDKVASCIDCHEYKKQPDPPPPPPAPPPKIKVVTFPYKELLALIDPSNDMKYSPNLHKWVKRHAKNWPELKGYKNVKTEVARQELIIGFEDDHGDVNGSFLWPILTHGARAERFCMMMKTEVLPNFWPEYIKDGRCAFDREHKQSFVGDEGRFLLGEYRNRTCLWCGQVQHQEVTEKITYVKEWINAASR